MRIWPAVVVGLLLAATASCFGQQPEQELLDTPEGSRQMVDPEILPLARLTTDVALPEERNQHGELVPQQARFGVASHQSQLLTARPETPRTAIVSLN